MDPTQEKIEDATREYLNFLQEWGVDSAVILTTRPTHGGEAFMRHRFGIGNPFAQRGVMHDALENENAQTHAMQAVGMMPPMVEGGDEDIEIE